MTHKKADLFKKLVHPHSCDHNLDIALSGTNSEIVTPLEGVLLGSEMAVSWSFTEAWDSFVLIDFSQIRSAHNFEK